MTFQQVKDVEREVHKIVDEYPEIAAWRKTRLCAQIEQLVMTQVDRLVNKDTKCHTKRELEELSKHRLQCPNHGLIHLIAEVLGLETEPMARWLAEREIRADLGGSAVERREGAGMTDTEILQKLGEIERHYTDDEWSMYDLQNDIEDIFRAIRRRCTEAESALVSQRSTIVDNSLNLPPP